MINVNHPQVLAMITDHRSSGRWDSSAFLIWYLENYYRIERQEAIDAVCDKPNDKGVDGIWVNDDDESIVVFQSRLVENPKKTVGDAALRGFGGTLRQFDSVAALSAMVASAGMAQVASLIKRLDLVSKLPGYSVRGEFLSNLNIDSNGNSYLKAATNVTFIGKEYLETRYISDSRDLPSHPSVKFDTKGYAVTEYLVDAHTKALIAPIKASELVRMKGIADQSLFAHNVRGPLGNTPINKAIVGSIKERKLHKSFPLFHNGITVIASSVTHANGTLTAKDYYVVNGCQSLTTLFTNQGALTENLRILSKFIQLEKVTCLTFVVHS